MAALEKEPEVAKIVLGDDIYAFNDLMKSVYEVHSCDCELGHGVLADVVPHPINPTAPYAHEFYLNNPVACGNGIGPAASCA